MDVLDDIHLSLPDRRAGKVRVSYELSPTERLFVTTAKSQDLLRVMNREWTRVLTGK